MDGAWHSAGAPSVVAGAQKTVEELQQLADSDPEAIIDLILAAVRAEAGPAAAGLPCLPNCGAASIYLLLGRDNVIAQAKCSRLSGPTCNQNAAHVSAGSGYAAAGLACLPSCAAAHQCAVQGNVTMQPACSACKHTVQSRCHEQFMCTSLP